MNYKMIDFLTKPNHMAKLLLFSDYSKFTEIVCGGAYCNKWHTAKLSLLWHCYTLEKRCATTSKMWAFSAILHTMTGIRPQLLFINSKK